MVIFLGGNRVTCEIIMQCLADFLKERKVPAWCLPRDDDPPDKWGSYYVRTVGGSIFLRDGQWVMYLDSGANVVARVGLGDPGLFELIAGEVMRRGSFPVDISTY